MPPLPDAGIDKPLIPRDVTADQRLRRHTEMVAQILNSLMTRGQLKQLTADSWTIVSAEPDGSAVPTFNQAVGPFGDEGPEGMPGPMGATGQAGATGATGAAGADGATGATGPAVFVLADPGEDGMPGPTGPTGATGSTGSAGAAGADGAAGATGATGPPVFVLAEPGDDGMPGPVGPTGATGATGNTGSTGADGATGPQGAAVFLLAEEGEPGMPGPVGPTGATGATGAQGSQGNTGGTGPAGAPVFLIAEDGPDGMMGPPGSLTSIAGLSVLGTQAASGVPQPVTATAGNQILRAATDLSGIGWGLVDLGANVAGVLPAINGGTGQSGYTAFSILFAATTSTVSAFLPNTTAVPQFLTMTGTGVVGALPTWSVITVVGTITTGTWAATTIAVDHGGTGLTSYTSGDLIYASGITTLAKLGIGTSGQALVTNGTAPSWANLPRPNLLYNGDFRVSQRQASFTSTSVPAVNNDATYTLDTWILLAEANNSVNVAQSTTAPPTGSYCSVSFTVTASANVKFGFASYLEARDAALAAGGTVSLQFKAKVTGSSIGTIRAGIVQWTGTADAPTRDLVSVWGAAGTNPTLVTSWAFANTPADLVPTTSWQTFKIEGIAVSASATNIGVFIWNDDRTTTAADILWLADVKLEVGALCTSTEHRLPMEQQLARCQRYYVQLGGATGQRYYGGRSQSTNNAEFFYKTPVTMRATPTLGLVGTKFNVNDTSVGVTISALGSSFSSPDAIACNCTTSAATLTVNRVVYFDFTDTISFLTATAEL